MKVFLTALGCKLNQAEIDGFAEQFVAAGYAIADSPERADLANILIVATTEMNRDEDLELFAHALGATL